MARLRSPLCESNGIAACGIWRADKRDSNPGPPGEKVLNEVPLFRTFRPYTLWRRTSTPTIRSSCAWPASAGAQRRRESEEKFTISCAEWSDLDTLAASAGAQRRKRVRIKICRFLALKSSILSTSDRGCEGRGARAVDVDVRVPRCRGCGCEAPAGPADGDVGWPPRGPTAHRKVMPLPARRRVGSCSRRRRPPAEVTPSLRRRKEAAVRLLLRHPTL